eukprot:COSAG01_NODE_3620_length_5860_cov_9.682173_3_plen_553_part_00
MAQQGVSSSSPPVEAPLPPRKTATVDADDSVDELSTIGGRLRDIIVSDEPPVEENLQIVLGPSSPDGGAEIGEAALAGGVDNGDVGTMVAGVGSCSVTSSPAASPRTRGPMQLEHSLIGLEVPSSEAPDSAPPPTAAAQALAKKDVGVGGTTKGVEASTAGAEVATPPPFSPMVAAPEAQAPGPPLSPSSPNRLRDLRKLIRAGTAEECEPGAAALPLQPPDDHGDVHRRRLAGRPHTAGAELADARAAQLEAERRAGALQRRLEEVERLVRQPLLLRPTDDGAPPPPPPPQREGQDEEGGQRDHRHECEAEAAAAATAEADARNNRARGLEEGGKAEGGPERVASDRARGASWSDPSTAAAAEEEQGWRQRRRWRRRLPWEEYVEGSAVARMRRWASQAGVGPALQISWEQGGRHQRGRSGGGGGGGSAGHHHRPAEATYQADVARGRVLPFDEAGVPRGVGTREDMASGSTASAQSSGLERDMAAWRVHRDGAAWAAGRRARDYQQRPPPRFAAEESRDTRRLESLLAMVASVQSEVARLEERHGYTWNK